MSIPSPFSSSRLQALCRVAAYVLLSEYALNLLLLLLPLTDRPEGLFGQVASVLDTASLPLLAIPLLFFGFSRHVRPARWEWRFARCLRPMLLLVALLYVLLVPACWALGMRIQSVGDLALRQQERLALRQLADYRSQMLQAKDAQQLRRLVEAQPQLRQSLAGSESPFGPRLVTLPQQRSQSLLLLDRLDSNLKAETIQRMSNATGELRKQQVRLSLMALLHSLFFGLAGLIWPHSLNAQPPTDDEINADYA